MAEEKVIVSFETKGTNKAAKEADKVTDSVKKTDEAVQDTSASTEELSGKLDELSGGAITKLRGLKGTVKGVAGGFKGLRAAIISTGIGALIVAVGSLVAWFSRTEKGAQTLRVIMAALGAATNVIVDRFVSLGEAIYNAFTNPQEALKGFYETLKSFVIDRVNGAIESFGLLGSAIRKVFEGDFEGALEDAGKGLKGLHENINPVGIGMNLLAEGAVEAGNAIADLTREVVEETKAMAELERSMNDVKVKERELRVSFAQNRAEIEKLKLAAEDTTLPLEERIEAAEKAFALEQQNVKDTIANEEERLRIMKAQAAMGSVREEQLEEIAEQEVKVAELNEQSLTRQIELNNKINGFRKEAIDKENAALEEQRLKDEELANEKLAFEKAQRDALAITKDEQRALEIAKEEERYNALIAQAQKLGEDTTALEAAKLQKIQEIRDKFGKEDYDKTLALERLKQDARLDSARNTIHGLANLAQEGTDLQKGLAISGILADSVAAGIGIWRSSTSLPEPLATITRAAQTVALIGQTKKAIQQVNSIQATSTNSGASAGAAAGAAVGRAPNVNIVGQQQGNQALDSINQNLNNPVRAYVVSSDVTSAQSLDRRKVETATFGG